MKFIFADSMDMVDPNFDFIRDRSSQVESLTGMTNTLIKSLDMLHMMAYSFQKPLWEVM